LILGTNGRPENLTDPKSQPLPKKKTPVRCDSKFRVPVVAYKVYKFLSCLIVSMVNVFICFGHTHTLTHAHARPEEPKGIKAQNLEPPTQKDSTTNPPPPKKKKPPSNCTCIFSRFSMSSVLRKSANDDEK